ncbi:uncharacterized protein PG998_001189 [Apiospora kogelbergensis]|uniref:DUF5672 domain-containing protein n=1 Tax=Apiospora kogelbergensis TaxID=1337665 RepID=A0AAW0QUF2_9PEZI
MFGSHPPKSPLLLSHNAQGSQSPWASLSLTKPAALKAICLLLVFWIVAGLSRSHVYEAFDYEVVRAANETTHNVTLVETISEDVTRRIEAEEALAKATRKHTDRVAIIVENRPLLNLIPTMLHFHTVLGPEWPMIFYTVPSTSEKFNQSAVFSRAVAEGHITIRHLPPQFTFDTHHSVSLFLTERWLWEDLDPYSKILMFQSDSIICSASDRKVDDFIEWDLVGAPIGEQWGAGYNGGLSIRNRAMMLDVLDRWRFEDDMVPPYEDQWYYKKLLELPPREDGTPWAHMPGVETAVQFAVETIYHERSLGFHQPMRFNKEKKEEILQWCPEIGMITGAAFFAD